ncbi:MAG: 2OG-Fe(II) oxygenase, partial [Proteobacteria bacterium]|nr:2OG-Fe(II) oxygenase [Pseudomonadota bacterium]
KRRPLLAPDYRNQHGALVALLAGWGGAEDDPDKLILPLEHAYTMAELSFTALKGADAGIAGVLAQAAAEANCDLHLALVSIEESGIAEYNADYGRRRRRYYDEDDDDEDEEWEAGEITDASMTLSEWRRPDASATDLGPLPFEKGELCPPDAFEDLTPDDEHFQEATGNEGASFERSYSRAGLVLWPASRRLAVLNHGGLETTLPYLEDLVQRWQNAGKSTRPGLWAQADELSGRMLWSWSRHSWRSNNDNKPGRMLGLLCRLGNHDRIDQFLTDISAAGHYAAIDNAAILRAAALLPSERAVDRLAQIIGQNAAKSLPACSSLLRSGIELGRWGAGELAPAAATLVDKLPQDKDMVPASPWVMEPPALPAACVADLVAATSQIDPALAERALRHIMANSKQYSLDDGLVPAACALAAQEGSWIWPVAERLRGACLTHLQHRAVLPLEAPRDWARPATVGCTCADCRSLAAFLAAPDQPQWRLKAAMDRRRHVEDTVRAAHCDVDLVTEKRGTPHTLIATKNHASYERRVRQRREDLAHIATLTDHPPA